MRYSNEFTLDEANKLSIRENGDEFTRDDDLYLSGDTWGERYIGTMDDWKNDIPEDEDDAKGTGYYDWYTSSDYYNNCDDHVWSEYRDGLFDELVSVSIVDE